MKKLLSTFTNSSIRYQFIIVIGFLLTGLIGSYTYATTKSQRDFLQLQGIKQAKNRSKMIASMSKVWVLSNDYVGLEEVVNTLKLYDDLIFASVMNMQGKVIAHSNRKMIGQYVADTKQITFLKKIHQPINVHKNEGEILTQNSKVIDIFHVIHQNDTHIGWIHLRLDQSVSQENIKTIIKDGIIFMLASLFISIILTFLVANNISKHLFELINTMKKIRQGSKKLRAKESGTQEVSQLSKEFNLMLSTISKNEQELTNLNSLMSNIINSVENLIFVKDIEFKYIECNEAFTKFVGKPREEIVGKTDYDLFETEVADFFRTKDKEMLDSGESKQNYEWVTYPNGTEVYLLTFKTRLRNDKGEVLGLVGTSSDLTKEKKLEEELINKEEIMIAQSRHAAMGEMISMIAHQWRQPISVIAMGANNILADIELGTLEEKNLKSGAYDIISKTQELSKTIDDFKNFFRPERVSEEVLLKNILGDALNVIGKSLENNDIRVINEFDNSKKINTFSRELMQVLINILKNAKEALVEDRKDDRKIMIYISDNESGVSIKICDNAGGINTEIKDKIFNPYFTTKDEKNGTGLGLYMSKTIVEKHLLGTLSADNKNGGACFTINLPYELD